MNQYPSFGMMEATCWSAIEVAIAVSVQRFESTNRSLCAPRVWMLRSRSIRKCEDLNGVNSQCPLVMLSYGVCKLLKGRAEMAGLEVAAEKRGRVIMCFGRA